VLAITLAERGIGPAIVGLLLTTALISGALFSLASGTLVERIGRRATLIAGAVAMAICGALLAVAQEPALFAAAALLGTLSPGLQEVGPFGAIEQAAIAEIPNGAMTRRFAVYNIVGAFAAALGGLVAAIVPSNALLWAYGVIGVVLAVIYSVTFAHTPYSVEPASEDRATQSTTRLELGVVERLSLLFGLDALAGGFVVQSFIAYWLHLRFGVDTHVLGLLFFGMNTLAALSLLAAPPLAKAIGLLNTMIATHLPSNILLILVPMMPTFPLAAGALLARFALSQMDVPTRQAYTMLLVPPHQRTRAAGLTAAVRPAGAAFAPLFAGLAIGGSAFGLPFYVAGGLKIVYDLTLFAMFRRIKLEPRPSE
jgi:MFS family permease